MAPKLGLAMDDKPKIRIKPDWLDAMIPPAWMAVADALAKVAESHKVPDDRMRLFIRIGSEMPDVPLVEAVSAMASGEVLVTEVEGGYQLTRNPGFPGLILPN